MIKGIKNISDCVRSTIKHIFFWQSSGAFVGNPKDTNDK